MMFSKILIGIILFVVIAGIQVNIHNRPKDKVKMFWVIPSSIIYSIAAIVLFMRYMPWINSLFTVVGFRTYLVIFINVALMLGYLLMKLTQTTLLRRGRRVNQLLEKVVGLFYEYDDVYDVWCLQKQWVNYRKILNATHWGIAVAAGALTGATIFYGEKVDSVIVFPAIVTLIFSELYYCLNGRTREEFDHSVGAFDADSRKSGQYFRLREILEKILPDPLLSAQTGFELAGKQTPTDYLNILLESEGKEEKLTANYYLSGGRYRTADIDGVNVTLDLMRRENVVYFNPFYRDLDMCLTLPLSYTLMSGKKCLVITGRMSTKDDISTWIESTMAEYTHMPSLWFVRNLTRQGEPCDVGVISFPELYDQKILESNQKFFNETDLVIMIEPSIILGTGQMALSVLAQELGGEDNKPVYFICDRMVDGIVDTISHLLRTSFVKVYAPPVPRCIYTGMAWNASGDFTRQQFFDRQPQYLGNGIELAAVAVKNQIPRATWYGERKLPLLDVKWIAGQYYPVICQYMNQSSSQTKLYEKIRFMSNLWDSEKTKEQFCIVEDEFNNMFSTMRTFITRGIEQSFVNVFSENYLLRDYMRCNQQIFLSNPNAIPSLVPDYAKTERNTLVKLIMIMCRRPVSEEEILNEFHLVGCKEDDAYNLLSRLLTKYTSAKDSILKTKAVVVNKDELTTKTVDYYSVSEEDFRKYFSSSLAQAYYILEEEEEGRSYVDAKFFNQITQTLLPGQFVCYGGKYYLARHISPQTGVVLRRASDLFDDRKYYRQIRTYTISGVGTVLSRRKIGDIDISFIQRDIQVTTTGYLEMSETHDLRAARTVDLSDDPDRLYLDRSYKNKAVMQIRLPDADEEMRFTFSLVLMEMLRSLFPEAYPYVAVTAKCLEEVEGVLRYVVYPLDGNIEDDCVYIIEDSDVDLGIIESIDRNFSGLMEIMTDYLDWHFAKMREPEAEDPKPPSFRYESEKRIEERRSAFARLANRIRKLMGRGEKEPDIRIEVFNDDSSSNEGTDNTRPTAKDEFEENQDVSEKEGMEEAIDDQYVKDAEDIVPFNEESIEDETETINNLDEADIEEKVVQSENGAENVHATAHTSFKPYPEFEETAEITDIDGTDIFDESADVADNEIFELEFRSSGLIPLTQTRYQAECFLKFGFDEIDSKLSLDELMRFLRARGWSDKTLTQARTRNVFEKTFLDSEVENHCDFCGKPLSGISHETLSDGRVRCNDCSSSAITNEAEFKDLFFQILDLMEAFYGIKFRMPIGVEMTDARTIAKGAGMVFRPSKNIAPRALGYAQRKKDTYRVFMENGCPRLVALDTMVHELTHIWQYLNWDSKKLEQIYHMSDKKKTNFALLIVHEGMSVWAAIQYMYQIGETRFAMEQEFINSEREDVYGIGFKLYREQYPLVKDGSLLKYTPYNTFPPLDPDQVRDVVEAVFRDNAR